MAPRTKQVGGQTGPGAGSARVDSVNGAVVVMDAVHEAIHRGWLFTASAFDTNLANGSDLEMLVVTHADHVAHVRFNAGGDGAGRLRCYEDVPVSDDGTLLTSTNRNRLSSRTSYTKVYSGPTVASYADLIYDGFMAGGTGGNAVGGESESFNEFILKKGTNYLFRLTNISGTGNAYGLDVNYYEPES